MHQHLLGCIVYCNLLDSSYQQTYTQVNGTHQLAVRCRAQESRVARTCECYVGLPVAVGLCMAMLSRGDSEDECMGEI